MATVQRGALLSVDRTKRFELGRDWSGEAKRRAVNFIMLNPSIADGERDDMTIRKCVGFAHRWGYNAIVVTNLSPVVSTDPWELPAWSGLDDANCSSIRRAMIAADIVIAAWGTVDKHLARKIALPELIFYVRGLCARDADGFASHRQLYCIGETKDGSPRHPSRTAYTDSPVVWRGDL